jgi:DNA repair exonuclease SbcCD nuclease subunit
LNFSFIHISDIHLSRPFSGLSSFSYDEKTSDIYKNAVIQSLNKVVDFAIMKSVDFVFIAGDTFDSTEQDFASKLALKDCLNKLMNANIKVFLICGNHDPLSSYSKNTFNYDENSKVKIIGLNTQEYCDLELINKNNEKVGILHALSFVEDKYNKNPALKFSNINENEKTLFHIGLLHCDLNADSLSPYAPCLTSDLKKFNYDYWALGHIHIPTNNDDTIQYAGTLQGRNTKETGAHGIRYIKVENNTIIKNSFIPMDVIRFEDLIFDVSNCQNSIDIVSTIQDKINLIINDEQNRCDNYLLRLDLQGCVTFFSEINEEFYQTLIERIKTNFASRVYISQIKNSLIPKIDENLLKEDEGISGEIYKTVTNNDLVQEIYSKTIKQWQNLFPNCNFNDEEIENFTQNVIQSAKEECINLCSSLYNNESDED